ADVSGWKKQLLESRARRVPAMISVDEASLASPGTGVIPSIVVPELSSARWAFRTTEGSVNAARSAALTRESMAATTSENSSASAAAEAAGAGAGAAGAFAFAGRSLKHA